MSKSESPGAETQRMLEMLFKRARHAKWSLFGLFFGISCFLTLSLVILISMFFPASVQLGLVVTMFVLGMGAMLIGVWYEVLEMWASFKGLAFEYEIHRRRTKR